MKKTYRILVLALLACVVFLAFIIARFPASQALGLAARFSQGMILPYQASGTVWQGRAEALYISINGQMINLGVSQWQLKALPLLWAHLELNIQAKSDQQSIQGQLTISPSTLTANDLQVKWPISELMRFSPVALPLQVDGQMDLNIAHSTWNTHGPLALEGNLVLRDIVMNFGGAMHLGTYAAKLHMQESFMVADVSDLDASVKAQGVMKASLEKRQYSSDMRLQASDKTDERIKQILPMLGKQQADGQIHIQEQGQF